MARQTLIILTILTTLIGCNFSEQVKNKVDSDVKEAKLEMDADISNAKSDFEKSFNQTLKQSKDSILTAKVVDLYSRVTKTSLYIDSLRKAMDKLDDMDTKNIELIKQMFLYDGIGDSVFAKVKKSYSLTIDIAVADTTKTRLKNVTETYSDETQKLFFQQNSPLGVNMILYGIESELIKDGTRCLAGHTTK
ncbi:hypothetical protein GCM10009119_20020 [Algoriphagus jejuensis]|uniref:Uncharacterized protein n=1 Tax=Algoriphagus jejuensis TaxID=419934 RepID=A0ABP3YC63_9BACT